MFRVLVISLIFSIQAYADSFYIKDTESSIADKDLTGSVKSLVQSSVSDGGNHQVTDQPKSADFALEPKLLKLGNSYILIVDKRKNGTLVFSQQLKATSADDLDLVTKKVTRAVLNNQSVQDDQRVSEVTGHEEKAGSRRRETHQQMQFAMGPAGGSNLGKDASYFDLWLSLLFNLDQTAIRGFLQSTTADKAGSFGVGIGMLYFLNDRSIAPYLGGSFAYGSMTRNRDGNEDRITGFQPGIEGGYQFFRDAKTSVDIGVWTKTIFAEYEDGKRPLLYGFRVGLAF